MQASEIIPHVVAVPQSVPGKDSITQLGLEVFLSLPNRPNQFGEQVDAEESGLMAHLEAGAAVEPRIYAEPVQKDSRADRDRTSSEPQPAKVDSSGCLAHTQARRDEMNFFSIQDLAERWRCSRRVGLQPHPRREGTRLRREPKEGVQACAGRRRAENRTLASAGAAMTFRIKKRGKVFRLEGRAGEVANVRGWRGAGERERIRLSLGTGNSNAAQLLHGRIERALAEGPTSAVWRELRTILPSDTFAKLAGIAGHAPANPSNLPQYTWKDLAAKFRAWMSQRVALDKLRESTRERYLQTCATFGEFLVAHGIAELSGIGRATLEDFKAWRLARLLARRNSRGGRGVVLDVAILHGIFAYAMDCELIPTNPVRMEGRPGDQPERGAQPFTAEQLKKLRQAAGGDMLAFLLLRWTGMRGSDVVGLRWEEIDWETREINRLTLKRRKRVVLPIHQELFFALEVERDHRKPDPEDRVLLNPATGRPLTRPRLYRRMLSVGRRAAVLNAHPHRYRDTCAVDLLARGASPYDVAKLLGDTVETVEKHYAPYVRELRERARRIMESGEGLEITGPQQAQQKQPEAKPNRAEKR
jgi:integrase